MSAIPLSYFVDTRVRHYGDIRNPFGVVYRLWREDEPEPDGWRYCKSFHTAEQAIQSADDRNRNATPWPSSNDGGKAYQNHLWRFSAANLVFPESRSMTQKEADFNSRYFESLFS